jgi:NADH:ubiquinone oxidoreductase subunit 4 (subunit M)
MNPIVRSAILVAGLLFVILFAGMTLVVLAEDGLTILVFFSLLIVVLLLIAIWGALNGPDDRR